MGIPLLLHLFHRNARVADGAIRAVCFFHLLDVFPVRKVHARPGCAPVSAGRKRRRQGAHCLRSLRNHRPSKRKIPCRDAAREAFSGSAAASVRYASDGQAPPRQGISHSLYRAHLAHFAARPWNINVPPQTQLPRAHSDHRIGRGTRQSGKGRKGNEVHLRASPRNRTHAKVRLTHLFKHGFRRRAQRPWDWARRAAIRGRPQRQGGAFWALPRNCTCVKVRLTHLFKRGFRRRARRLWSWARGAAIRGRATKTRRRICRRRRETVRAYAIGMFNALPQTQLPRLERWPWRRARKNPLRFGERNPR